MSNQNHLSISFNQISNKPVAFNLNKDNIIFKGNLVRKDSKLVICDGKIYGDLDYSCDRCGSEFKLAINEDVLLYLSDGIYKENLHNISDELKQNPNLDVIEFFNGYIDMDDVLNSEIEAYKSGYFYCEKCINL